MWKQHVPLLMFLNKSTSEKLQSYLNINSEYCLLRLFLGISHSFFFAFVNASSLTTVVTALTQKFIFLEIAIITSHVTNLSALEISS